jgi:uncharacterized protein YjiK
MARATSRAKQTLHLTQGRSRPLAMRGASAIAAVPGTMYFAEDDEGIYRERRGRLTLWASASMHTALRDLEGLAMDPEGRCVWALAEETGQVVSLATSGRHRTVKPVGRLDRPGRRENKGYEGLAYLPGTHSPNRRNSLIAVHEGNPRRVGVFALPDLSQTHEFKLPRDAKKALADLADLTVDPVTGAWLLLSEESRRIGVFAVGPDRLRLESLTEVRVDDGERPEGLDFVTPGRLVVVTEGPARAIEYRVTRSRR